MKGKRLFSFLLALVMILGMVPVNVLRVFAAEENGWYWVEDTLYVKDGVITYANLHAVLYEKSGSADSNKVVRWSTSNTTNSEWGKHGTKIESGSSADVSYTAGTTYYAAVSAGSFGSATINWYSFAFILQPYYDLTATVAEGSPAGAGISLSANRVQGPDGTVAITVEQVAGYTASVTDSRGNVVADLDTYAPTESTTLTVTYTRHAAATYHVSVKTEGPADCGTAALKSDPSLAEGEEALVEVELTPDTPSADYFVVSVKVGETSLPTNDDGYYVYTMGAADAEIVVTLGKREIANTGVMVVPYYTGITTNALKEAIFHALISQENCLPIGITVDDVTIQYDPYREYTLNGNVMRDHSGFCGTLTALDGTLPADHDDTAGVGRYTYYKFGERWLTDPNVKEKVRVTGTGEWAGLYIETEIMLGDARTDANVQYHSGVTNVDLNGFHNNKEAGLAQRIYHAVVMGNGGHNGTWTLEVYDADLGWLELNSALWNAGSADFGPNQTKDVRISWTGTSTYKPKTIQFQVRFQESRPATEIVWPSQVTFDHAADLNSAAAGAIRDVLVVTGGAAKDQVNVTVTFPEGADLVKDQFVDATVQISVAGTADYQAYAGQTKTVPAKVHVYYIKWLDANGNVLETDGPFVPGEQTLAFNQAIPTLPENTAAFTYSHGWDVDGDGKADELDKVTISNADVEIKTLVIATANRYTVTWKNWNGTVLATQTLEYGKTPAYTGEQPSKTADAQHTYVWSGWDKDITEVTGDVTYTAKFNSITNSYTVTWKDEDGSVLDTDTVAYGETPAYGGATPTKVTNDGISWAFAGWTPTVSSVTGNVTYTATFAKDSIDVTIVWGNGSRDTVQGVESGSTFARPNDPIRKGYRFDGWTLPAGFVFGETAVTAPITLTARWVKVWTVTYQDGSAVLHTVTVDDGTLVSTLLQDTPTKEFYIFQNWTVPGGVERVTADLVLTAKWLADANKNNKPDGTAQDPYYDIVYDFGGKGTNTVYENQLDFHSAAFLPGSAPYPVQTFNPAGFAFGGWSQAKVVDDGQGNITVTYTAIWDEDQNCNGVADQKETLQFVITGNGMIEITWNGIEKASFIGADTYRFLYDSTGRTTYTMIVTPDTVTVGAGKVYYVSMFSGLTLTEGTLVPNTTAAQTVTFTNGVENKIVTVAFAERTLNATDGQVAINKHTGAQGLGGLKTNILTSAGLIAAGYPADALQVTVSTQLDGRDMTVEILDDKIHTTQGDRSAAFEALMEGKTEMGVEITLPATGSLPAVTRSVIMKINDSRTETVDVRLNSAIFENDHADIDATGWPNDFKSWIHVNGYTGDWSVELTPVTTVPSEGAENAVYTIQVTVRGDETYLPASHTFHVTITNPIYAPQISCEQPNGATIVVKDREGNTINPGAALPGTYTVAVTPAGWDVITDNSGWYVNGIRINGGELLTNGTWNNGVYTCKITLEQDSEAARVYALTADTAQRKILLNNVNDTANDRYQQPYKSWTFEGIFGLVNATEDFEYTNGAIVLKETNAAANERNTFVLTWAGDDRYPTVTTSVEVYLTNELMSPGLTVKDGTFAVTKDHVGDHKQLNDTARAAIEAYLDTLVKTAAWEDAQIDLTYNLGDHPFVQGTSVKIAVTAKTERNDNAGYLGEEKSFELTLAGKVEDWTIHSNADTITGGVMTVSEPDADGKVTVTMTPAMNYFESGLVLTTHLVDHESIQNHSFHVANGTGLDLGVVPTYTVIGAFTKAAISIPAAGEMNYYVGMDTSGDLLNDLAWSTIQSGMASAPESLPRGTICYLARPSGSYPISLTLDLGILGNLVIHEQIPMPALWLEIGDKFPTDLAQPSQNELQAIAMRLIDDMSLEQLKALCEQEEARHAFVQKVLEDPENEALLAYITYFGAHSFGKNDVLTAAGYRTEVIRVEAPFDNCDNGKVISNNCTLTLTDTRAATEIHITNRNVTLPYGFTEAQLLSALGIQLQRKADGTPVDGTVEVIAPLRDMGASDMPYTVTLEFVGNDTDRDCTATATVTVIKAAVQLSVDDQLLKWCQGLTYANPVITAPGDVDTIILIAGLNVSDRNVDGSIQGLMGGVQLIIPDSYLSLLTMAGLESNSDLTAEQLKALLLKVLELTDITDSQNETVTTLLNMLESLPTDIANMHIRLGGALPTDIGVYVVAGITADANYETDFGVGAIVINPDGKKAELAWNQTDSNDTITRSLLVEHLLDLGAHVTSVAGGDMAEAEAQLVELFLGVDIDGNLILQTKQEMLNVGTYVEVALIANFGNEMYDAEPLARPVVVVPALMDLDFLDENGNIHDDRKFTFDDLPHALNGILVSEQDGTLVLNTVTGAGAGNGTWKICYAGASTNGQPVFSQTPPTRVGSYLVVGVYLERDSMGLVSRMAVGRATMVILPAKSDVIVENQTQKYEQGMVVTTGDMIHASSSVPGLAPDVTILTAGLRANGSFSELGLEAIQGNVNADLPTWLDELLKKYGILEAGYTENGITKETLLAYVDQLESILADNDLSVDAISGLVELIRQLPARTAITFRDQAERVYDSVGIHLAVAVVTDSNHDPSIGAGLLAIYPDAAESELKFNKTWDDDHVFTWEHLQTDDMGATAYTPGTDTVDPIANILVKNIYVGFTVDGKLILTDAQADLEVGAYDQTSVVLDAIGSQFYYAKPISRTVVVVPDEAIVEIEGSSEANHVIKEEYDGNAHDLQVQVFVNGQPVQDPGSKLKLYYAGTDSAGKPYNSTVAPVNAGVYVLTALYTDRNEADKHTTAGTAVATLIIEPAKATMDVENEAMKYDGVTRLDAESLVHVSCGVAGKLPQVTVITAMLNPDGSFSENDISAIQGSVNVDLPTWLDEKLPENGMTEGMSVAAFLRFLNQVETKLEELGVDFQVCESLRGVASQLPAGATVTFHDQAEVAPGAVGTYLIIGLVTDPNFYPALDAGLATIYPDGAEAELQWIYQDQNNIYTPELLKKIHMGAQATAAADLDVRMLYLGVDTNRWKVLLLDSQDQLHHGVYTQFAFPNEKLNSQFCGTEPISRPIIVVPNAYQVDFHDGDKVHSDRLYLFDNTEKGMGNVVIHDQEGNPMVLDPANLTVTYVGTDPTPGLYNSGEMPVHVGTYTVVATYTERDDKGLVAAGVGIGTLVIAPADVQLKVESQVIPYGKDYTITMEAIHGAIKDDPERLTIIVGLAVAGASTSGASANIDLPAKVDEIFKTLVPEWYEDGISTTVFKARIQEFQAALNEQGYSAGFLTRLVAYVDSANAADLTFRDDDQPTDAGVYGIITMTMDPDYQFAVDTALLIITPDAALVEIRFDMPIPGERNILHANDVPAFNFGAHVLAGTGSDVETDYQMRNICFGLNSHGDLVFLDAETGKPSEAGVYDQLAYVNEQKGPNLNFIGIPDLRTFSVALAEADIQFAGTDENNTYTFTYGDPIDITVQVVDSQGKAMSQYQPTLFFISTDTTLAPEWTGTMPTDAGVYTVAGYYFSETENVYAIGFATLVIEQAELTITADDKTVVYGDTAPACTVTYDGFRYDDDGDVLAGKLQLVHDYKQFDKVGQYKIDVFGVTAANYHITFVPGTLHVEQKEVALDWSRLSADQLVYDGKANTLAATVTNAVNGDTVTVTVKLTGDNVNVTADGFCYQATGLNDSNYKLPADVTSATYHVIKAANAWTQQPSVDNWVEGDKPNAPDAAAVTGEVTYKYFSDEACTKEVDPAKITSGTYYLKACVTATANYQTLESAPVAFAVLKNVNNHLVSGMNLQQAGLETNANGETSGYVRGFAYGASVEDQIQKLKALEGATLVRFTDGNGNPITDGIISTGMKFTLRINGIDHHRVIVVMGDVNGDGKIYANDYMRIKNQIMEVSAPLVDAYALAADIDGNGEIFANDYMAIKNHIMEVKLILQTSNTWEVE